MKNTTVVDVTEVAASLSTHTGGVSEDVVISPENLSLGWEIESVGM